MRAFLSNFLLATFIVVFAVPQTLLAQSYNWTPPTGAAFQNNTPSPINVSQFEQTKTGDLNLSQSLNVGPGTPNSTNGNVLSVNGQVIFSPTQNIFDGIQPNNQILASFLPKTAFFGSSTFMVGTITGLGGSPSILLSGKLKYTPRNPDGSLVTGQQPAVGRVLTVTDASGGLGYTDGGLPPGSTDGDILIWDETCNCWITGPNDGDLPDGTNQYDILVWDTTTNSWIIGIDQTGDGTTQLPAGAQGQTMWYDNNAWRATDQIKHTTNNTPGFQGQTTSITNDYINLKGSNTIEVGMNTGGRTLLRSPITAINADQSLSLGVPNSGQTNINSPSLQFSNMTTSAAAGGQEVDFLSKRVSFFSPEINFLNSNSSNPLFGPSQTVNLQSSNVNFKNPVNGPQAVKFESSDIKFKGPTNNPLALEPGAGRIPYSVDANGTFKWNRNFIYTENPAAAAFGWPTASLELRNNAPGEISSFSNAGITYLADLAYLDGKTVANDDVRITDQGDLYLDEVDFASILPSASSYLVHLCWNTNTKKVMRCPSENVIDPVDGTSPGLMGEVTETFYTTRNLTFDDITVPTDVSFDFCGGGGGGGGGGAGTHSVVGTNNSDDQSYQNGGGGGGGGGGGKGRCTQSVHTFNPGDVLTMEMGAGGLGGAKGFRRMTIQGSDLVQVDSDFARPGGWGGNTVLKRNGAVIDTIGGGGPGLGGTNAGGPSVGFGGGGGSLDEPDPWWNIGSNGNSNQAGICVSCGGQGGTGERWQTATSGDVYTAVEYPVQSGRGTPGFSGPTYGNGQLQNDIFAADPWRRWGGPGANGYFANGGGGGGGSFGFPGSNGWILFNGGNGGNGGGGYVTVSYSTPNPNNNSGGTNSWVQSTAGTYTFDLSTLPVQTTSINLELWGGGAGGGPFITSASNNVNSVGGGGGGGAYRALTYQLPPECLPTNSIGCVGSAANLTVTVGAGGALGVSSSTGNSSNLALPGSGTETKITRYGSAISAINNTSVARAYGGNGGGLANPANYPYQIAPSVINDPTGAGGAGGLATNNNGSGGINGNNGQGGENGGFGGTAVSGGFGRGGNGGKHQVVGGISTDFPATSGQDGGVRISW